MSFTSISFTNELKCQFNLFHGDDARRHFISTYIILPSFQLFTNLPNQLAHKDLKNPCTIGRTRDVFSALGISLDASHPDPILFYDCTTWCVSLLQLQGFYNFIITPLTLIFFVSTTQTPAAIHDDTVHHTNSTTHTTLCITLIIILTIVITTSIY